MKKTKVVEPLSGKPFWFKISTMLFSAVVVPIYVSIIFGLWPVIPSGLPAWLDVLLGLVFLSFIPIIIVLYFYKKGKTDINVSDRTTRVYFYIISIASYATAASIFSYYGSHTMMLIATAYVTVSSTMFIINLFWKVSAHTAGTTGPFTALVYVYGPWLSFLYIIIPFVIWLRFKIRAHTIPQLVAGAVIALIVTWITYFFLY